VLVQGTWGMWQLPPQSTIQAGHAWRQNPRSCQGHMEPTPLAPVLTVGE
jgi:hypothetical protein